MIRSIILCLNKINIKINSFFGFKLKLKLNNLMLQDVLLKTIPLQNNVVNLKCNQLILTIIYRFELICFEFHDEK